MPKNCDALSQGNRQEMKKIGLVGGISWTSTIDYYRILNKRVNQKLGGLTFCECIIYSLNFNDFVSNNVAGNWHLTLELMKNAANALEKSGAEAILLCANTAHAIADELQDMINLPIINIIDETGKTIKAKGYSKAALIGTQFTMEMDFYRDGLAKFGIEMMVPQAQGTRDFIQKTVKEELGCGILNPQTKAKYIEILNQLIKDGAQCIILGCTEIPLLITQEDFDIEVFDTTKVHANAVADFALS